MAHICYNLLKPIGADFFWSNFNWYYYVCVKDMPVKLWDKTLWDDANYLLHSCRKIDHVLVLSPSFNSLIFITLRSFNWLIEMSAADYNYIYIKYPNFCLALCQL